MNSLKNVIIGAGKDAPKVLSTDQNLIDYEPNGKVELSEENLTEVEQFDMLNSMSTEACIDRFKQFFEDAVKRETQKISDLDNSLNNNEHKLIELANKLNEKTEECRILKQKQELIRQRHASEILKLEKQHQESTRKIQCDIDCLESLIKEKCVLDALVKQGSFSSAFIIEAYCTKFTEMKSLINCLKLITTQGLGQIEEENICDFFQKHVTTKKKLLLKELLEKTCSVVIMDSSKRQELDAMINESQIANGILNNELKLLKSTFAQMEDFELFERPIGKIVSANIYENKNKLNTKKLHESLKVNHNIYGFLNVTQNEFYFSLSSTLTKISNKEDALSQILTDERGTYEKALEKKDVEIRHIRNSIKRDGDFEFSIENLQSQFHDRYIKLNLDYLDKVSLNSCKSILKNCLFLLEIPFEGVQELSLKMQKIDSIISVERVSFLRFVKSLQKLISDTTEMDYEKQVNYLVEGKRNKYRLDDFLLFIHNSLENMIQESENSFSTIEESHFVNAECSSDYRCLRTSENCMSDYKAHDKDSHAMNQIYSEKHNGNQDRKTLCSINEDNLQYISGMKDHLRFFEVRSTEHN